MCLRPSLLSFAIVAIATFAYLPLHSASAQQAQTPAATDAAPAKPPVSAATAYFDSMKSNHSGTARPAAPAKPIPPAAVPAPPPTAAAPQPAPAATAVPPAQPSASSAAQPVAAPAVAAVPDDGRPAPHKAGHGLFKHEKAPKLVPVTIQRGVLTIDGWTGKADLNYHIFDLRYLYFWVPGTGVIVVSHEAFPGSKFEPSVIDGNTLTVTAEDHKIQLTSEHRLLNEKAPEGAYVAVDHDGFGTGKFPQFGYGDKRDAYAWPASMAADKANPNAPPMPEDLRPKMQTVQLCHTNPDGTKSDCHDVSVPMATAKSKKAS